MTLFIVQIFHGAWGAWDEILPILVAVLFTGLLVFAVWYSRRLKADVETPDSDKDQSNESPHHR